MDEAHRWYDESFATPYDLRSSQYCFVKFTGQQVVVCDTSGEAPIGILQNHPQSGDTARVRVIGRSKVKGAGGAACGGFLKTNHSGMAISATAGDWTLAWAQQKLAAGTERFVMVCPMPQQL